ncbi:PP0621 family protein [Hydrogenophaga sp.]|uniref:PP0621 family protein n=1 Tax=Hydrogenophaga sp. TaxID=1904254 RepID=UPI00271D3228|nr:PP0621 family protein [Hydrogenophaga sp.]MDO9435817.1 PP0621 family protein [Hydrogenophaga sp.]
MKYLLVLAVVMVAFYIWRNNRLEDHRSRETRKPPPTKSLAPTIMVACRQCGTHLPENEAVHGRQGVYCSAEHQRLLEG